MHQQEASRCYRLAPLAVTRSDWPVWIVRDRWQASNRRGGIMRGLKTYLNATCSVKLFSLAHQKNLWYMMQIKSRRLTAVIYKSHSTIDTHGLWGGRGKIPDRSSRCTISQLTRSYLGVRVRAVDTANVSPWALNGHLHLDSAAVSEDS